MVKKGKDSIHFITWYIVQLFKKTEQESRRERKCLCKMHNWREFSGSSQMEHIHLYGTPVCPTCSSEKCTCFLACSTYSVPVSHWLVTVIVRYIILFSKPACNQTTHLYRQLTGNLTNQNAHIAQFKVSAILSDIQWLSATSAQLFSVNLVGN